LTFRAPLAAILLCACAAAGPTPAAIVDAERAFAADGYALGFKTSFLKHSAADAIVLTPHPTNAHQSLAAEPDEDLTEPRPHLIWWPLYAGIARSGDLGFTTGPYAIDESRKGHYFTVWRKGPDGVWKWVIDAGIGADSAAEAPAGSPVAYLPTSRDGAGSPEAAMAAVRAAESALAARAADGLAAAYAPVLDADSRLHSSGPPPAKTPAERAAAFAARPPTARFAHRGGGASAAGDLAWTYGEARWRDGETERLGYYVRVWQKRAAGWRLVFDELIPTPSG
jgi:ketosteroid isomerase-like protein